MVKERVVSLGKLCECCHSLQPSYENARLIQRDDRPVYECNDDCGCASSPHSCRNRIVQRGPRKHLKIVAYKVDKNGEMSRKGYGVITERFIPRGAFICVYAGELIGTDEANERFSIQKTQKKSNYIMILREFITNSSANSNINDDNTESVISEQRTIIDPSFMGNIGRYLNHSCEPNVRVVPIRTNSMVPDAAMFAATDILAGHELTYDYGCVGQSNQPVSVAKKMKMEDDRLPCLCHSAYCRGYLPYDPVLS